MISKTSSARADFAFLQTLERMAHPELERSRREAATKWGSLLNLQQRALGQSMMALGEGITPTAPTFGPPDLSIESSIYPRQPTGPRLPQPGGLPPPSPFDFTPPEQLDVTFSPPPPGVQHPTMTDFPMPGGYGPQTQIPSPLDVTFSPPPPLQLPQGGPLPDVQLPVFDPGQHISPGPVGAMRPPPVRPAVYPTELTMPWAADFMAGGPMPIPAGMTELPLDVTFSPPPAFPPAPDFAQIDLPAQPERPELNTGFANFTPPPPAPGWQPPSPADALAYNPDQPEIAELFRAPFRGVRDFLETATQDVEDFVALPSSEWRTRGVEEVVQDPGATPPQTALDQAFAFVSGGQQEGLSPIGVALAGLESGGRGPSVTNYLSADGDPIDRSLGPAGYSGKFQFGEEHAKTIGVYSGDDNLRDNIWHGTFNVPGFGQMSYQEWLGNEAAQDATQGINEQYLRGQIRELGLDSFIGSEFQGVPVTEEGLIMGAHQLGLEGLGTALRGGDDKDGNGTPVRNYLAQGAAVASGQPFQPELAPMAEGIGYQPPQTSEVMTEGGQDLDLMRWLQEAAPRPLEGDTAEEEQTRRLMSILMGVAGGGMNADTNNVGQLLLNLGLGGLGGYAEGELGILDRGDILDQLNEEQRQAYAAMMAGVAGDQSSTNLQIQQFLYQMQRDRIKDLYERLEMTRPQFLAQTGDGQLVMQTWGQYGPEISVSNPDEYLQRRSMGGLLSALFPEGEGYPELDPNNPMDLIYGTVVDLHQRGTLGQVIPADILEDIMATAQEQVVPTGDPEMDERRFNVALYGLLAAHFNDIDQSFAKAAMAGSPIAQQVLMATQ